MRLRTLLRWTALTVLSLTGTASAQLQPSQVFSAPGGAPPSASAIRSATFATDESQGNSVNLTAHNNLLGGGSNCASGSCGNSCASGCASNCGSSCGCASPTCITPGCSGCAGCGDCACGCTPCCCPAGPCVPYGWMHNFAVYGEFLYLRSRNAEIPYAVVQNSNVAPPTVPVQVSRLGVLDPDFEPAYRFGFTVSPGACSSFGVQYTMFESGTNDTLNSQTGFDVIPLIFHPTTITAATAGTAATARHNMSFDKIDADYRELLSYGPAHRVNYLVGASYANLEQQLNFNVANNSNGFASTDIDFDGAGLRFGIEAEHFRPTGGPMIYGKALTTILAGEFDTYYAQGNDNDPVQVQTSWSGGRVVPVLDLELGFGYTCAGGLWRVTGGYQYSAWFNTVTTQEWIRGVQNNDFVSLSDTLTFDGLVGRIEGRF